MSSSKKKVSKSKKKQSSNIHITPPPNPPLNLDTNAYHPIMFSPTPDEPMFSPTQTQMLANLGKYLSENSNAFSTPSPPLHESQVLETQFFSSAPQRQVEARQFSARAPRRLISTDTEEDEEEEEEQAAEEEDDEEEEQQQHQQKQPSKGRRKGKGQVIERSKAEAWKVEEVLALAQTWIDISEDAAQGNDQDMTDFQERIWVLWCKRMGRTYRTSQSIYSKWRNASKIAKEFESIFTQLKRNWRSGATIDDVMVEAREEYAKKNGRQRPFNVQAEAFWRAIRDNEKWKNQKSFNQFATGIHATKRSKTSASTHSQSSDANVGFDMNAEPEDETLPPGRDKTKRKMRAGSTSTTTSTQHSADMQALNEQVDSLKTLHQDRRDIKLMEIVMRDISGLRGLQYQIAFQAQKDAARRLGYTMDDE